MEGGVFPHPVVRQACPAPAEVGGLRGSQYLSLPWPVYKRQWSILLGFPICSFERLAFGPSALAHRLFICQATVFFFLICVGNHSLPSSLSCQNSTHCRSLPRSRLAFGRSCGGAVEESRPYFEVLSFVSFHCPTFLFLALPRTNGVRAAFCLRVLCARTCVPLCERGTGSTGALLLFNPRRPFSLALPGSSGSMESSGVVLCSSPWSPTFSLPCCQLVANL